MTDELRGSVGCENPHKISCGCGRELWVKCSTSRASVCGPCSAAYRGRVGLVAGSGLVMGSEGLFLTLTAPGGVAHYLPNGERCSCTPDGGVDLARWNARASSRFNRFMRDLRRTYGDSLQYFRAGEVQRRGALHFHVLLRMPGSPRLLMRLPTVRQLALKHGFGHSVDLQPLQPGHAAYVAKYVAKSADSRGSVPWNGFRHTTKRHVNETTGELVDVRRTVPSFTPTYRTWSDSRCWGRSMREIRSAQAHFVALLLVLPSWEDRPTSSCWARAAGVPDSPDPPPA